MRTQFINNKINNSKYVHSTHNKNVILIADVWMILFSLPLPIPDHCGLGEKVLYHLAR